MAKNSRNDAKKSKVTIRYMEVETEGSDEAIQDAWRSLQSAFARPRHVIPTRVIAAGSGPVIVAETEDAAFLAEEESYFDADGVAEEVAAPKPKSTRSKTPRKEQTWPILEIEKGTGPNSLESFMQKAPDVIMRRFLMFMYWLKTYRDIGVINPSHIVTCYRLLGWAVPPSMLVPLADMRRKRQWIDKAEGVHEYSINHAGVAETERMLNAP